MHNTATYGEKFVITYKKYVCYRKYRATYLPYFSGLLLEINIFMPK